MSPTDDPTVLVPLVADRYERYLADLEELVSIDSGSLDHEGVNRVADVCQARFLDRGWDVERQPLPELSDGRQVGDVVIGRLEGSGGARILLMAHMDTVFDVGTARERPFRIEGARALGPGVCDDKGGIVAGFTAVDALRAAGFDGFGEIVFVLSPDEEIASPGSIDTIERLAEEADVALCLEAARENGDIVSARKGVADLRIEIVGRAAHSGVEPERGVDAALEAAHKTVALSELNDPASGVTCNVGVLRAGTRRNVIAPHALLEIDLRAWTTDGFEEAVAGIERITGRATVDGATATVRRMSSYPPMERTEEIEQLATLACAVAGELGLDIGHAATGGSADANTAASVGTPVIDGLGPVGGDDHSPEEWLDLASIVPRVSLLAGIVARLGPGEAM